MVDKIAKYFHYPIENSLCDVSQSLCEISCMSRSACGIEFISYLIVPFIQVLSLILKPHKAAE